MALSVNPKRLIFFLFGLSSSICFVNASSIASDEKVGLSPSRTALTAIKNTNAEAIPAAFIFILAKLLSFEVFQRKHASSTAIDETLSGRFTPNV